MNIYIYVFSTNTPGHLPISLTFMSRFGASQDPAKKLWIGNIPAGANWTDLQALVDKALSKAYFLTSPGSYPSIKKAKKPSKPNHYSLLIIVTTPLRGKL